MKMSFGTPPTFQINGTIIKWINPPPGENIKSNKTLFLIHIYFILCYSSKKQYKKHIWPSIFYDYTQKDIFGVDIFYYFYYFFLCICTHKKHEWEWKKRNFSTLLNEGKNVRSGSENYPSNRKTTKQPIKKVFFSSFFSGT